MRYQPQNGPVIQLAPGKVFHNSGAGLDAARCPECGENQVKGPREVCRIRMMSEPRRSSILFSAFLPKSFMPVSGSLSVRLTGPAKRRSGEQGN
jgi:hypothetical protein